MVLTFKSSSPEQRVVIERAPDGRQRVARATMSGHNRNHWNLRVEHPNGQSWNGSYNGDGANVIVALAEMLTRTEQDYREAKVQGDRPRQNMAYDHSRRVNDDSVAPVRPI